MHRLQAAVADSGHRLGGFWLILGGGLLYTVGAVLYGKGKTKPFMHCVFHVFVILGSVCHVLAILLFAI